MYFYRSDCRFCALQSPLVKQLKDTFGFEVLAVSLDGSSNDHFPDALPDNGVSKLLTNGWDSTEYLRCSWSNAINPLLT